MMSRFFVIAILLISKALVCLCNPDSTQDQCNYEIVESMPDKMHFDRTLDFVPRITHEALIEMINESKETLKIASFYLILLADASISNHPSTKPGKDIMTAIESAVSRGVKLEMIVDNSSRKQMSDPEELDRIKQLGTLKFLNMTRLLKAGVLHSKFMIVDQQDIYVGSSNFDWRSYSQIKEMGIRFKACPTLANDLDKIFKTYMLMADEATVPGELPDELKTSINRDNPFKLTLDGFGASVYLAGSPPAFNGVKKWIGRSDDIDSIIDIIDSAKHHVGISVMNYSPRTSFIYPKKFWPRIDDALRRAASERKVQVRLLFSDWDHTKAEEVMWWKSLNAVQSPTLGGGGIHVKLLKVPAFDDFEKNLPYSRVKHDKFLVTDNSLYIGTSNWTPDYFINTCGVGVVIRPSGDNSTLPVVQNMRDLFNRDFESQFSHEL